MSEMIRTQDIGKTFSELCQEAFTEGRGVCLRGSGFGFTAHLCHTGDQFDDGCPAYNEENHSEKENPLQDNHRGSCIKGSGESPERALMMALGNQEQGWSRGKERKEVKA